MDRVYVDWIQLSKTGAIIFSCHQMRDPFGQTSDFHIPRAVFPLRS
jgi:hypothetical protein